MAQNKKVIGMVECAILIALATVLSLIKFVDLPYGGSITVASMLPIALISYRRGLGWGLGSALVYAVIQQLFGLKNLSYATSWQAVIAIIMLDYIIAFVVIGLAGMFRKKIKSQTTGFIVGTLIACLLRYLCHVLSGATVWAGISIPTTAALLYSISYNATYMIPETIVTLVLAFYISSSIDLRSEKPVRVRKESGSPISVYSIIAGLFIAGGLIYDVVEIFSNLQNADSGEFDISAVGQANWCVIGIVSAVAAVVAIVLFVIASKTKKANKA
ncbi:MAG: energy-coupled thiamine transporter ThiT [Clostridiales bacterium]|nr:energy-coupled thiamine transporter ThiT [Clostridiales bacterium]